MKLYPLTHIIIALEFALTVVILPIDSGIPVLFLGLFTALLVPSRTEVKLSWTFLKILGVAAIFLFLMHGVQWNPPGISRQGIMDGLDGFIHIAIPVICVVYLTRQITTEELYGLLMDFRVPSVVIFVLFRTLWLVPRLMERMDEVVTAQKLRGMRIENSIQRTRAIIPTISPIFSSMVSEISENSLTLTARRFLLPGPKSHLLTLRLNRNDISLILAITALLLVIW